MLERLMGCPCRAGWYKGHVRETLESNMAVATATALSPPPPQAAIATVLGRVYAAMEDRLGPAWARNVATAWQRRSGAGDA